MGYDSDGYEKNGYTGQENIKEDMCTSGRPRNTENKNKSGNEGAI